MSPIDYSGGTLKEFGPKVGESKVIHIREAAKVEDPTGTSEENFRSRTRNFGYRFELTLTNGRIFPLNVWKLFFAFKEADVQDGDKIQIDHPAEGVYRVTVLEKGTGIGVVVEDTEKQAYEEQQKANKPASNTGQAPVNTGTPDNTGKTPAQATNPSTAPAAEEGLDLPF